MIKKFTFNNAFILNELENDDKVLLLSLMRKKRYLKNQSIFVENSYPAGIFFIDSGRIKKFKVDNDGREQIIQLYNKEQFFGYSPVLSNEQYGDCATAIEDSVVSIISIADFHLALDKIPLFSKLLLKCLSHEFSVMANIISMLSQRSVRERVAISLIILEDVYHTSSKETDGISISKGDIASMAGTTPETLARILHDFKDEKLISTSGKEIFLKNIPALEKVSNFM